MKKLLNILILISFTNQLLAAEFSCQKIVEKNDSFLHCVNKIDNYPRPVHFFYPNNLKTDESVNLNLHFQGYNIEGYDPIKNFGNLLVQSSSNTIVVVPESLGKDETYNSFFANRLDGTNFITDVIKKNSFGIDTLSFSGHSGAFQVLRTIFSYKNLVTNLKIPIIGVGLFDATYSNIDSITDYAVNHDNFIFFDSYIIGEKGSASKISIQLKDEFQDRKNFIFHPVNSTDESGLEQHFKLIQRDGLRMFLDMLK